MTHMSNVRFCESNNFQETLKTFFYFQVAFFDGPYSDPLYPAPQI